MRATLHNVELFKLGPSWEIVKLVGVAGGNDFILVAGHIQNGHRYVWYYLVAVPPYGQYKLFEHADVGKEGINDVWNWREGVFYDQTTEKAWVFVGHVDCDSPSETSALEKD